MKTVTEAADIAMKFVTHTFGGAANGRLEEIDSSDDGRYWYITVSIYRGPPQGAFADSLAPSKEYREYKTVTVDAETGEVKKVVIRQLT